MADNLMDNTVNFDQIPVDPKGIKGDTKTNVDLDKFFETLEQQVNGEIYSTEPPATLGAQPDSGQLPVDDLEGVSKPVDLAAEVATLKEELDNFKQRYSDSSLEAIKLAKEAKVMDEYRDYIPILRTMREDPGLIDHVRNYLDGNLTPGSIKDQLSLPEDFVFDSDEAIRDPGSNSAKVFQTLIDRGVEQRLKQHVQVEGQKTDQREQIRNFRDEMKMTDDEYNDFHDWAANRPLTLKDIYYLKTRESREKEIAKKAIEEREKQLLKMKGVPPSIAATGSYAEPVDEDKEIFAAIQKAAGSINIFD